MGTRTHRTRAPRQTNLTTPYTIVVDSREQAPLAFANHRADVKDGALPLVVRTVRACLGAGDYSLLGYETRIAIERKSASDLFSTLGQSRRRFQCELDRLAGPCATYEYAAVVAECDWSAVITCPPKFSKLNPKSVFRSVIAWQLRYPRLHWWFCPGRAFAEVVTLRLLERFWKVKQATRKEEQKCRG